MKGDLLLRALRVAFACALISLAVAGTARAAGGTYAFQGGTPAEQQQVRDALDASSFPWSVVPRTIVIHIGAGLASEATPGDIWIDSNLLDSGRFSWGIVQHEYAHQVDFLLFNDATRAELMPVIGGKTWCWGAGAQFAHDEYGCERFASTLTWAFWPSPDNALQPQSPQDEAAGLPPAQFKALLGALLKARTPDSQLVAIRSFVGRAPEVKQAEAKQAQLLAAKPAAAARREATTTRRPARA